MSPLLAVFLVLVLGATSYAAGRLHGQLSYRIGYRFGYRQGYFDGDRGAWNRRRREAQAAIASALAVPVSGPPATPAGSARPVSGGTAAGGVGVIPVAGGTVQAAAGTVPVPAGRQGTTYTGASFTAPGVPITGQHQTGTLVRRQG
ncbi:hypothetical protein [Micromonospora sp. KC721]|uniref:hypothetical protein n=1 Tax=Micromonospora sp. KC721 TaxID=2530380 RepID=UPI00104C04D1|nr:hypothetical protein [Micromonospora sp. KC721]TDB77200.1 hypothetical protein E1182_17855 [Micromonospora sp. KC721]